MGYFHCHWYVTTRCNSRCATCTIWKDPKYKSQESSLAERIAILHQLKQMGFKSIDFTGGEPLLYKGLPALIRRARRLGFFTSLTTNGTLYPRYAEALRGTLVALSFSLDGPDAETHDVIRGIKCYDNTIRSIILARKLGEMVMLKTTVCNDNVSVIPKILELAARYGVLVELNPEFAYFGNPPLADDHLFQLFKWWKHPNVIVSHAHLRFMLDKGNDIRRSKCPVGTGVLVLAPDNGLYFPCMHYVQTVLPLKNLDIRATLATTTAHAEIQKVGHYEFCQQCTIPCYFEASYFTQVDKYWPICIKSRLGYLRKRAILGIKRQL